MACCTRAVFVTPTLCARAHNFAFCIDTVISVTHLSTTDVYYHGRSVLLETRGCQSVVGSGRRTISGCQRYPCLDRFRTLCALDAFEPEVSPSRQQLQAGVVESLTETGIGQEEALRVAENAPRFMERLLEGTGQQEPDELDRWARLSTSTDEQASTSGSSGRVVQLSTREQWAVVLESSGVRVQNIARVSYLISSSTLPEFLKKVRFLEEVMSVAQFEGQTMEGKVHQMMMRLSVPADEDLQRTLSFFEKMEAQRGGLTLLNSSSNAVARIIEDFPQIFVRSLDTELVPALTFLEALGVPKHSVGRVVLLFPPVLMSDIELELQPRIRALKKVGIRARDLGKMVSRYPWLLSRSVHTNLNETVEFLFSIKVPGGEVDRAITRCPQLLGCSSTRTMQPIVWRLNKLGVKSKRLGRVIAYSPQLLLQTPEELNKVVNFLEEMGVKTGDMGSMVKRSPELFASDLNSTLKRKVQFLKELGIKDVHIWRVLRMFPEMLTMSVDNALQPRVEYLQERRLTKRNVAFMVVNFPPLLGYTVDAVLKPKLDFLVFTMKRPVGEVVGYPRFFSYSLEKRIRPRAQVLEKRKINCDLKSMLAKNDNEFASEYLGLGRMLVPFI